MKKVFQIAFLLLALSGGVARAYDLNCGNDCQPPPCLDCCPAEAVGSNPINAATGNLHRQVTDLETFGAAPIQFTRIYNSRTTNFNDPYWDFGSQQTWQHNWNYEARQLSSKSFNQFDIKVRYPDGREYNFTAPDATSNQRIPPAQSGDRLYKWSGSKVGYTLVTPDGWEYDFLRYTSPKFHLTEARDGQGLKWTFTYGSDDKLKRIANQFGRWIELERTVSNGVSCVSRVFSNDGRQVLYSYSPWTPTATVVLTGVIYPGTETAAYSWVISDPSSPAARPLLETASDPLYRGAGAQMKYVYNYNATFNYGSGPYLVTGTIKEERNLVTGALIVSLPLGGGTYPQILEGNGTEIMRKYEKGQLKAIGDGEGRTTVYTRSDNGYGFVQSIVGPNGGTTSFTKDYAGRVLTQTDTMNHTRTYAYNDAGFEISHTDERNFTTYITRDSSNRMTRVDYPDGAYETWTYNIYGQVLTHQLRNGGTIVLAYYDGISAGGKVGDLKTSRDSLGNVTTYTYSESGLTTTEKNARNYTTSYTCNWRGQMLSVTHPDNSVASYEYDAFGNRTREVNELGKVWERTYNEYQRAITRKDPLGRITTYEYGREAGCASCGFADTLSRVTLPSGKKTEFTYDRSWKRTAQIVGAGTADAATTAYTYDAAGDQVTTADPRGKVWIYTYDLYHRRISATDPLGNKTRWTYDATGNQLAETRPDNGATTKTYDMMNRLTSITDPLNQVTSFGYGGTVNGTSGDNLLTFTDARNSIYTFTYDLLNRRIRMSHPDGSHEDWSYDVEGNPVTYTTRAGQSKTSTFDNRNREIAFSWSGGSASPVSMTFDAAGHLLSLSNNISTLNYTYDNANQLLGETSQLGSAPTKGVNYTYDLDGHRASVNYPSGGVVTYSYTGRNQLASVTADGPPPLTTYAYDLNGNPLTKSFENDTITYSAYDDANRLLSIAHQKGSTTFASFTYGYSNVGNRTFKKYENGTGETYAHDGLDQLTGAQYGVNNPDTVPVTPSRVVSYTYDAVGNRTSVADAGNTTPYTSNSLNQYTTVDGIAPSYDLNGNQISYGNWTYGYDAQNRLTNVTGGPNGINASFAYDAANRCVSRTVNGNTFTYVYDGWNLIEESVSDVVNKRYIHGAQVDEILAMIDSDGTHFYHHDGLGSTARLTNSSGGVEEDYSYDVFGAVTIKDGAGTVLNDSTIRNRFLFTGREWLPSVKLYDYRNRFYRPDNGRFLTVDPLGAKADINFYAYAQNKVLRFTDPNGLMTVDQCNKAKEKALNDPRIKDLKAKMGQIKGCVFPQINCCDQGKDGFYGYTTTSKDGSSSSITINPTKPINTQGGITNTILHELIHAYDNCKDGPLTSCEERAYREMRAFMLSGNCSNAAECIALVANDISNKQFGCSASLATQDLYDRVKREGMK